MKSRRFNFFISVENDKFLKEESQKTGLTMSEIIENALNQYRSKELPNPAELDKLLNNIRNLFKKVASSS